MELMYSLFDIYGKNMIIILTSDKIFRIVFSIDDRE